MSAGRRYCGRRSRRAGGGGTRAARTVGEVTDEWNRRSGENISRARVWQILRRAEEKLASVLGAGGM